MLDQTQLRCRLQADLKTCSAHNVYAATVITAITAQNTIGVNEVMNVTSAMIESQLKTISEGLKNFYYKNRHAI